MKVVCGECAAKYQIPDERVAGRRLKIRCRKCGGVMEARGDDPAAFEATIEVNGPHEVLSRAIAPSLVPSAPHHAASPEWFVSIDGAPAGPLNTQELVSRVSTGVIDWDAHVWREGYENWSTIADSDTLVRAVASARSELRDSADSTERTQLPTAQSDARDYDDSPTFAARDVDGEDSPTHATLDDSPTRIAYDETPTRMYSHGPSHGPSQAASSNAQLQPVARASFASRPPGSLAPVSAPRSQAPYAQQQQQDPFVSRSPSVSPMAGIGALPPITTQGSAHAFSALAQPLPITSSRASLPPAARPGYAGGEGSGIIDIRALASLAQSQLKQPSSAASMRPQPAMRAQPSRSMSPSAHDHELLGETYAMPERHEPADPFASMGTHHGVAFAALDSIAPVSRKVRAKDATVPLAILAGAGMIAAAAFAALYVTRVPSPTLATATTAPIGTTSQPIAQPTEALAPEPEAIAGEPVALTEPVAAAPDAVPAEVEPIAEEQPVAAPDEETAAVAPRAGRKSRGPLKARSVVAASTGTKSAKVVAESEESTAAAEPAAPPPTVDDVLLADDKPAESKSEAEVVAAGKPKGPPGPDTRSIDDLLSGAVPVKAAPAAKPELAEAPSRDDVLAAMRGIETEVRACAASEAEPVSGTAAVAITVVGTTGRVKSAEVTGIQGSVGSCIARVARKASFSPFSRDRFSVTYPYRFK